jgi:N-acetylmuramoyl-L-alanine amidase
MVRRTHPPPDPAPMKIHSLMLAGMVVLVAATVGFRNLTPVPVEGPSLPMFVETAVAAEEPGDAFAVNALEGERLPRAVAPTVLEPTAPGTTDPIRIALQAGHWLAHEAPDELAGLRSNGTRGGGKAEWEVTLEIARLAAQLLEEAGYEVDVLPTTVPPGYRADLFVAIHADGHTSTAAHGFTVGAPRRDATGRAQEFADLLERTYQEATSLRRREVTRRMQGYYAFNSRRYEHALDPGTVGVILETGFLTNAGDRDVIVHAPERSARGIAEAVTRFIPPPTTAPTPTVVAR